jgi:hypothetical protein
MLNMMPNQNLNGTDLIGGFGGGGGGRVTPGGIPGKR